MLSDLIEAKTDLKVERKLALGGTMIAFEALRSGEIDKLKDYVNSTEFIEKMAREKLGLVYDDEIIFKAEK